MRDRNIWIFNAGLAFEGNPKWLFLYITNYRKEICPYWFCYQEDMVQRMHSLGYKACLFESDMAKEIGEKAGVYVVNQKKEVFQSYLKGITILNLWHGVGCKTIEKGVNGGFLNERIVKKTIKNAEYYQKYQLFLVTSPMMEQHFMKQCGVPEGHLIRAGYPCCVYPDPVSTFAHDLQKQKGLPLDTKIAVYAPTYRDYLETCFFSRAICDMNRLAHVLEKNNFLLIFKMHPQMIRDFQYQNLKARFQEHPRFLFWDNQNDFYEMFDQIELAIVDYSSIFYDMLAKGIKNFARYIFDYGEENTVRDFAFDYKEMTCGKICSNFEELLSLFSDYKQDNEAERQRIYQLFWSYSNNNTFETIIERAQTFEADKEKVLPTLYSFDIFDTLIGRSTLQPAGIFLYIQDKMNRSALDYPVYVKQYFFKIRPWAESNCRDYYRKSQLLRQTDHIEITLDMIYLRIQQLYGLTEEQTAQLKSWELECEYASSIPYQDKIELVKDLVANGETVVLISDMYLPKEFILKLLEKADSMLPSLPLYLSSEYGVQKTTKKLFFEAYHDTDYHFGEWIHYGDNPKADGSIPRSLSIKTVNHKIPVLNHYEKKLNEFINTYDAFRISALFARFREGGRPESEVFSYAYASLYLVPYISWVTRHAAEQGTKCLYFISRDGHYLKLIADAIIRVKQLPLRTKYIYGSRKAWRIPSQAWGINEDFFSEYGNFVGISRFDQLLDAADISEAEFLKMFPELDFLKRNRAISETLLRQLRDMLRDSEKYRAYLKEKAKQESGIVLRYLQQEIDFSEQYAFVEFWGRGYAQSCLAQLLWQLSGTECDNIFYYARSIYPTHGRLIRHNFTGNSWSYLFIEAIFANVPYKSVRAYEERGDRIEPVLRPCENLSLLHQSMEIFLPRFAEDFASCTFQDLDAIERSLFDFGLSYFHRNSKRGVFLHWVAPLKDSVAAYGSVREYAPRITLKAILRHFSGQKFATSNKEMSIQRSDPRYRKLYNFYCKQLKTSKTGKLVIKIVKKFAKVMSK